MPTRALRANIFSSVQKAAAPRRQDDILKYSSLRMPSCSTPMLSNSAAMNSKGLTAAEATPVANTLVITGTATDDDIRKAVEQAGLEFKGRKDE